MVCPVCDAEVYEHDVESCWMCGTLLATWTESDRKYHSQPLFRCCRCGECPSPGDRACRQCHAHFLKRAPAWLDADFPGWMEIFEFEPDESVRDDWKPEATFWCVGCDMDVAPGQAQCQTCGLRFYKPTQNSSVFIEPDPEPKCTSVPAAATTPNTVAVPSPAIAPPAVGSAHNPTHSTHVSDGKAARIAARIIPPRARLLAERQASYKVLLASGSIRPVPSLKWLSGQPVVCTRGHQSQFGLFAHRPGYGTLDCLPDFKEFGRHNRLAAAFHGWSGAAKDNINDRDPKLDVCWSLGCPMCGTDQYTFEAETLRDYAMCTASADYWWVFCHLYRIDFKTCGNCELRKNYWTSLRSLE